MKGSPTVEETIHCTHTASDGSWALTLSRLSQDYLYFCLIIHFNLSLFCLSFCFSYHRSGVAMPFGCLTIGEKKDYNNPSDVTDKYDMGQLVKSWVFQQLLLDFYMMFYNFSWEWILTLSCMNYENLSQDFFTKCFYSSLGMKNKVWTLFFSTYILLKYNYMSTQVDSNGLPMGDSVWDDAIASTVVADVQLCHQNSYKYKKTAFE